MRTSPESPTGSSVIGQGLLLALYITAHFSKTYQVSCRLLLIFLAFIPIVIIIWIMQINGLDDITSLVIKACNKSKILC